jgi:hypothetical protein
LIRDQGKHGKLVNDAGISADMTDVDLYVL